MRQRDRQKGVVLVVSLLMIAVLALLATASINLGSGSMQIVSNQQAEQNAVAAANNVIEEVVNDRSVFTEGKNLPAQTRDGVTVSHTAPVCVAAPPVKGDSMSEKATTTPRANNYYRFTVEATENSTGATARIHAGVRIAWYADSCS